MAPKRGASACFTILCGLLALTGMAGCQGGQPTPARVSHAAVKRAQMQIGTLVTLTAVAPTDAMAQEAVAEGLKEVRRLEALWSTWIPMSQLSQANAAAGRAAVPVGPETMSLLNRALEAFRATDGGFTIAMGPVVDAWAVGREPRVPEPEDLERLRPLLDLSALRLDPERGTSFLAKSGMRIDTGGIGKGYAADLAAAVMRKPGASAGVVAAGGDIKTLGVQADGSRFLVGI